jgi:putative aldouronate transport system substrate-binding protein
MKRKIGSLLLAVSFTVTMALSGCGSSSTATDSSTSTTAPETTAVSTTAAESTAAASTEAGAIDPKTLKPVKLLFLTMGETPKNLAAVNEAASKYLTEKINATLEYRPIQWGNYDRQINLMMAANEKMDLIFTASWMFESQWVARGSLQALDELLPQYAPEYLQTVPQDVREAGYINGKAYGLTGYKEWAAVKGLVFDKKITDKYGMTPDKIKTWSDLTPYLEQIKKGEPGMVPIQARSADSPLVGMMDTNAYDILGGPVGAIARGAKEAKVVNYFEQPDFMEAAKLMREWFKAGYINKNASSTTEMTFTAVKAGKAAGYNQSGKPGIAAQEGRQAGKEVVYFPMGKPFMTTGDAVSALLAVPTSATDPARSVMFANLLHKDKYLVNLLNWGIEGADYVKVDDNTIKYPDGITAQNSGYNLNMSWLMGDITLNYLWDTDEKDIYQQYKTFNDSADRSLALGFSFNSEPVKNEVAAVNNVINQYTGAIFTGSIDPEVAVPKFIAALKAAGSEKIIAEKQKQLDAFVAAKK